MKRFPLRENPDNCGVFMQSPLLSSEKYFESKRLLRNEEETTFLGQELALIAKRGDLILLYGTLGMGKTTLARGFIRTLAKDTDLPVLSPTFSLLLPYEICIPPVLHCDFYRLTSSTEVDDLGFAEIAAEHVTLVEWPEHLDHVSSERLEIHFWEEDGARGVFLRGYGTFTERLERLCLAHCFLDKAGLKKALRGPIPGDASSRRYERIKTEHNERHTFLLMDMPTRAEPKEKDGRSYSEHAHLALTIESVLQTSFLLAQKGFSAPTPWRWDRTSGFLLHEDFGEASFSRTFPDLSSLEAHEAFQEVTELLFSLAQYDWHGPFALPWQRKPAFFPRYDKESVLAEVDLFITWYLPFIQDTILTPEELSSYHAAWEACFSRTNSPFSTLVLRDVHGDNLFWLPEREGKKRVGLIDTQDAVLGHRAYDLVSFLQDARREIPKHIEEKYLAYYIELCLKEDHSFQVQHFLADYAFWSAQRATKILGVFSRLAKRDGKPRYLEHIPRTKMILENALNCPALKELHMWFTRLFI